VAGLVTAALFTPLAVLLLGRWHQPASPAAARSVHLAPRAWIARLSATAAVASGTVGACPNWTVVSAGDHGHSRHVPRRPAQDSADWPDTAHWLEKTLAGPRSSTLP
jgi:hypothetical protein